MSIGASLKAWAKRIKRDGVTLWFAGKHPRTPWYAKALGVFVVAYALSPIDLIPDAIPVLGLLDDLLIVPLGLMLVLRLLPPAVLADARAQAAATLARPRSLVAAAVFVALWLASAAALLWWWLQR